MQIAMDRLLPRHGTDPALPPHPVAASRAPTVTRQTAQCIVVSHGRAADRRPSSSPPLTNIRDGEAAAGHRFEQRPYPGTARFTAGVHGPEHCPPLFTHLREPLQRKTARVAVTEYPIWRMRSTGIRLRGEQSQECRRGRTFHL